MRDEFVFAAQDASLLLNFIPVALLSCCPCFLLSPCQGDPVVAILGDCCVLMSHF